MCAKFHIAIALHLQSLGDDVTLFRLVAREYINDAEGHGGLDTWVKNGDVWG